MAERQGNKNEFIILTLARWVDVLHAGGRIDAFLHAHGVESVAVYGYGHLGRLLTRELHRSEQVRLACVVDQSEQQLDEDVPFVLASDELPEVDAILVTAVYYFDEIRAALMAKGVRAKIVSLYDVLNLMEA